MVCFPMSPQSLFDCFFSTCCTNTPTYVHYFLADFLTLDLTKNINLHFQWLPVVASLNFTGLFEWWFSIVFDIYIYTCFQPLLGMFDPTELHILFTLS